MQRVQQNASSFRINFSFFFYKIYNFINYLNDNYISDLMHKDYAENFRIFLYTIVEVEFPKFFANEEFINTCFMNLSNWQTRRDTWVLISSRSWSPNTLFLVKKFKCIINRYDKRERRSLWRDNNAYAKSKSTFFENYFIKYW